MSQYTVTIQMTEATVKALGNSGYSLYQFGVVGTSDLAALPLVWVRNTDYSLKTLVNWSDGLHSYTSLTPWGSSQPISVGFSAAMQLGQLLTVSGQGLGEVSSNSQPGDIAILNSTTTPFVCGIELDSPLNLGPICAMPLYGNGLQLIQPVAKTFLMFATGVLPAGTAVGVSHGLGILIDMTGETGRAVSFDINDGWTWGSASWAEAYPALTDLGPLLTPYSPALAREAASLERSLRRSIT